MIMFFLLFLSDSRSYASLCFYIILISGLYKDLFTEKTMSSVPGTPLAYICWAFWHAAKKKNLYRGMKQRLKGMPYDRSSGGGS
ncbi:MAG: hypothetical protein FD164_1660 [Nitrospirae bacterium]|nr:MAG: hypothetical protein FD164_1660 [Nitrospirota bacterium]